MKSFLRRRTWSCFITFGRLIEKENTELMNLDFPGIVHKVQFNPFNSQNFILLFQNNMVKVEVDKSYTSYYFGKLAKQKRLL